jgi:Asp-tRNA(Asn)/Glu-tRNA(Gln) amidotransferase A subunit family amidase
VVREVSDRRAFLAVFATTSFATTLLPGVLWAQMQQGTKVVTAEMVREAAKLAGLELTDAEAADLTSSLSSLARGAEGIGRKSLTNASPLPLHFDPRPHGVTIPAPPSVPLFRTGPAPAVKKPASIEAAAYWPIAHLARLLRARQITSSALTEMYLARLTRYNSQLNCVAELTAERARSEAAAADQEIAAGKYRGVLHGIPYGVKDIIAAKGYPTRWGAKPLEAQTFDEDATVVTRLRQAGAVLAAKLTTGELAFGDQWAGGRTNNPWNLQQGSSGSSAGSASAMGAGLVAFAIGSDTGGSILYPAARCGIVGLRPTFGRVSRYGVMTAGSSLDKIGPMCRHVEDCAIVLQAIAGPDNLDLAVPDDIPVTFDATGGRYPRRIGYVPAMMGNSNNADQRANNERVFATLKQLGCTLVDLEGFPSGDLSYFIEYTERAAAFESLVGTGLHTGVSQRTGRFLRAAALVTAADYLQANRRRAVIMQEVARRLAGVDVVMFTALALNSTSSLNPVMSLTGHPSIAVPNGFNADGTPSSVMFSGQLYHEGALLALARAYEGATKYYERQPKGFAVM